MRGGLAKTSVEASAEQPALFLERSSKIANLAIDRDLNIKFTDEAGAPVDLSVVHVDVYDPAGRMVRYYSGNVTMRDGVSPPTRSHSPRTTLQGIWRVRARDVISGLVSETTLQR